MVEESTERLIINDINGNTEELFGLALNRLEEVEQEMKYDVDCSLEVTVKSDKGAYEFSYWIGNDRDDSKPVSREDRLAFHEYIEKVKDAHQISYEIRSAAKRRTDIREETSALNDIREYFSERFDEVADDAEFKFHWMDCDDGELESYKKVDDVLYGFDGTPIYRKEITEVPEGDWNNRRIGYLAYYPEKYYDGKVKEITDKLQKYYEKEDFNDEEDDGFIEEFGRMVYLDTRRVTGNSDPKREAELFLELDSALREASEGEWGLVLDDLDRELPEYDYSNDDKILYERDFAGLDQILVTLNFKDHTYTMKQF